MEEPPESSTTSSISIENLPREILWIIFSYMDQKTVQSSTATCKLWFELIRGNSSLSSHICLKTMEDIDKQLCDLELTRARWPALKTVDILGEYSIFEVEKIAKYSLKLFNSMDCPTLEKIIISSLDGLTWFYLDVIGNTTYNMKGICIRFVNGVWSLELKKHFRKRFCQMLKLLTNSVQKVQLQVLELSYINILYPELEELADLYVENTTLVDLKRFDFTKMCEKFKNLKTFHIDVSLHMKSEVEDHWMNNEFPVVLDAVFQDITDVKIQFYLETHLFPEFFGTFNRPWTHYTEDIVFMIIKKPNQKLKFQHIDQVKCSIVQ